MRVTASTVTAVDLVARLTELGFRVGRTGVGMTLLEKGEHRVIIPHVTIEPPMLRAILRSAGISEREFFGSSGRSRVGSKTTPPPDAGAHDAGE